MNYKVKASQVKNLTDARYFAAREVDVIGFAIGSEGLNWHEFKAISEWIQGPEVVVEPEWSAWELLDWDFLKEKNYKIQIPMLMESAQLLPYLGMPFLKEWVLNHPDDLENLAKETSNWDFLTKELVLDCTKGTLSWEQLHQNDNFKETLNQLSSDYTVWIDAHIEPEIIQSIEKEWNVYGFQLKGGEEEKVGFKSFDELDALLDVLKPMI